MQLKRGKAKGEFIPGASKLIIMIPYTDENGKVCFALQIKRNLETNITEGILFDYINKKHEKRYEWKSEKMDAFKEELKRWDSFDLSDLESYFKSIFQTA